MKSVPKRLWIVLILVTFAGIIKATLPPISIGNWTATNNLSQVRANGTAVLLQSGRTLFIGGDTGSGATQSAEIFGTDGSVSSAAPMNYARSAHFAVVLSDGRVLVGGGVSSGGGTTNSAEIYDPSSDSWSKTGTMAEARANATAALLQDGRILIAGGDNSGNASNTIEIFDPSSGSFTFAGTLSASRTQHAMAVLQDGRVLIVGGTDGTNPLSSSDIYDPSSGNVSAGPNLATARYAASATTLLNGDVAVIGGTGSDGNGGTTDLASIEIFDSSSGAFKAAGASLATAREGHQAFLFPNNNGVLIVGGSSGGTALASSELLTPQISTSNGAWSYSISATGNLTAARAAASGSANQKNGPTSTVTPKPGLVIVGGGKDASGAPQASTEAYGYATVQTSQDDYAPGTTVNITGSGFQPNENVDITLVESPLIDTHGPYTVQADGNGNISDSSFVPDAHDVSVRFYMSAVGSQSGEVAQNTFTDANPNTLTIGTATPLSISTSGGQTTYAITETFNGNNTTTCKVDLTAVGTGSPALPAGTTFSFSSPTLTSTGADQTSTLTVTSPTGITANTYSFTVTSTPEAGSCQNNPKTLTATGTLVVHGAATQVRVETAADGSGSVVPAQTVTAGNSVTVFAIERDSGARFISNVAAVWSLANKTGGVADSDLAASADNKSATFTGHSTGTAQIKAVDGAFIGTSGILTVISAAASKVAFTSQPGGATAGVTFTTQPIVSVEDAGGNVITSGAGSTATITLSITSGSGTSGATLTCTGGLSKAAVAGVATFAGCKIDEAGTNYQLHAVSGALSAADSTAFDVANAVAKFGFTTGPFTGVINQCLGPITIQTQNAGGTGTNPPSAVQVDLSVISGGTGAFFSDAACGSSITNVSIPTSANSANFFFKGTSSGSPVVQAADHAGVLTLATQTETINKRSTSTGVTLTPNTVTVGQASTVVVTITDTDSAPQSNPQGTIAFTSTDNTDVFGTCTLAPSGGNAATCSATLTPAHVGTSPHGITATFTPTDTTHTGSSNTPAASLTVNKADQTITFAALANKTYGDAAFLVSATGGGSGNPVTFTASPANVCTAGGTNGSNITITGAGACTVTAHQAGNADYNAATDAPQGFTVAKATAQVVVTPYTSPGTTYTGLPHTATITSITGVNGETGAAVGTVDVSHTTHTPAGTYNADYWTFTGTANYNDIGNTTITDSIAKANALVVVTPYTSPGTTYTGLPHTATVTSITGVNGETGATVGTVDVSNTTHTPAGTYASDYWFFTGTSNYNDIGNTTITDSIAKANATVVVTPYTSPGTTYTGLPHTAAITSITGVNGETGATVGTVDVSHTTHTDAGTYSADYWTFTGTANYNDIGNMTITDSIAKANATVVVTPYVNVPYDGHAHTATVTSITGVNGEVGATVGTVDVSHTTHTDAGTYSADYWTFTGTANYNDIGNMTITDSIAKANATVVVTPYVNVPYDGNAHTAAVTSITGVNGETGATVGMVDVSHTTHTPAGTYASDYWFFTGTANYNDIGNTTIADSIAKANATVVVTPYTSPGTTYTGLPHTAAVTSITGVNGETGATVGTVDVSNTTHTPAGTYASDYWFFTGTSNYNNIGNTTITDSIAKATATVVVMPYSVTYDGNPHTATVTSITGVNGETGATVGAVTLNTTHTNAGTYSSDYWTFTATANYNSISATTITDTIYKANATINVTPYNVTYDGNSHTATGTATGVKGENLSGLDLSKTTHSSPGNYTDSWAFTDSTGNYNNLPAANMSAPTINDIIHFATGVVCNNGVASHVILQPINADGTSVFKAGSTVPTKFVVCDASGNSVGPNAAFPNSSVVKSYNIVSIKTGTVAQVDENVTSTTPDTSFRWDPTAQQWIFNTKTGSGTSLNNTNATYLFQIVLIDGTIISGTNNFGMPGYQYGLK